MSKKPKNGALVRFLLALYPKDFRHRFGDEILSTAAERSREARRRGVGVAARAYWREALGLIRGAVAEHSAARDVDGKPLGPARRLWLESWVSDLTYGLRRLFRDPSGSAMVILTLALGLAVSTAVFTLVDHVLLRPLPYPDPERLVRIWAAKPADDARFLEANWEEVAALRAGDPAFSAVAALSVAPRDLADDAGRPMQVRIARLSSGFFRVLGVFPEQGRDFLAEEYDQGRPVVILSHGFWQTRYGGGEVLGRQLSIQGTDHEVVGVMPPFFDYPREAVLWRPFNSEENRDDDRELHLIARLAEDANLERGSAAASAAFARLATEATPDGGQQDSGTAEVTAWAQPLKAMMIRDVSGTLWALLAGVAALLALAVANVANLQLVRGADRRGELAVRLALGADRKRLTRQLIVESLVTAVLAGALGLLLARGLLTVVLSAVPNDLPRLGEVHLDWRVTAIVALITLGSGMFFGLGSAMSSTTRAHLHGSRGGIGVKDSWFQQALMAVEIGLATVLVLTASLCFAGVSQYLDVKPGFDAEGLISMGVSPPPSLNDPGPRQEFYEGIVREAAAVPGVRSVALGSADPVQVDGFPLPFHLVGEVEQPTARRALLRSVGPGYLETVGARLLAGRTPTAADHADSPGIAVVNQAFVETFLAGESALGRRLQHPAFIEELPTEHEIVGVVANLLPEASVQPEPWVFIPYRQFPWPRMRLLVRTAGRASEGLISDLRTHLWQIHPSMALDDTWPVSTLVDRRLARPRFQMHLMAGLSQLALLLTGIGLYGVVAYQMARRRREIGVRRALGAGTGSVVALVMGKGFRIALPGLALGLLLSLPTALFLERKLFGVTASAPEIWSTAIGVMVLMTAAAGIIPAYRALRVDPMHELRSD